MFSDLTTHHASHHSRKGYKIIYQQTIDRKYMLCIFILLIFNVYNLVNLMISIYLLNHHYNLCYEYTHHFQVFPSFFIYYNYFVIRAQHKIYPLSIFFCVRMPSLLDGKFHLYMGQICFVFHYVPCIQQSSCHMSCAPLDKVNKTHFRDTLVMQFNIQLISANPNLKCF